MTPTTRPFVLPLAVVAVAALVAGCGSSSPSADTALTAGPIIAAAAPVPGDTTCPSTGLWARCTLFKRLEMAGLNVRKDSAAEVREPMLSVPGFEMPIARGRIRVFLYADSTSRRRDQAKLDPRAFITPRQSPGLLGERTLAPSANMLVLMEITNEQQRERIANAVMAGPPQPKKP